MQTPSELALPLTTGHGMSALYMRWAVWLRGDQLPGNLLTRRRQNTLYFKLQAMAVPKN